MTQESNEKRTFSRRTVLAATAWSVPVVMVARAAPAFAGTQRIVSFTGEACKWPGKSFNGYDKAYSYGIRSENPYGDAWMMVVISAITVLGDVPNAGPFYNIYPQTLHVYIPSGSLPNEGVTPCGGTALPQADGSSTLTTFIVPPASGGQPGVVLWTASVGEFGNSNNTGMSIIFRAYKVSDPSVNPLTCGIEIDPDKPTTVTTSIHSTGPCCTSSVNLCPSYSPDAPKWP